MFTLGLYLPIRELLTLNRLWVGWELKKMSKKSEKDSFLRNLSVDSSADASADAPAIINIFCTAQIVQYCTILSNIHKY